MSANPVEPRAHSRRIREWLTGNQLRSKWNAQFSGELKSRPKAASRLLLGFLLLIGAALLLPENRPLLDPDEGRHAEIAREMLASGDWIVPRLQGRPYFEKPPLQYWLTAGAFQIGGLEPWVARVVPAVAAWLTLLLAVVWAIRHVGGRNALLGGMCLCLSVEFVILGRTVLLDALLTLCVTASALAAHHAITHVDFRWRWWLASAVACGFGILAKGPIALVLALPPVTAHLWLTCTRVTWRAFAVWAFLVAVIAAPWFVTMAAREPTYLAHFFWKSNIVRFLQPFDHQQPWWFYLPVLFLGTFPWSLLWPGVAFILLTSSRSVAKLRTPALGFCVLMFTWCGLFFSLSGCKSPAYLLPAIVPLALLTGACLEAVLFLRKVQELWLFRFARQALPILAASLILLLSGVTYGVAAAFHWSDWNSVIVPCSVSSAGSIGCLVLMKRLRPLTAWGLCAATCVAFGLFPARDLYAAFANHHSPITVVRILEDLPPEATQHVITADRVWYSASFYLRRTIPAHHGEIFWERLHTIWNSQPTTQILVRSNQRLQLLLENIRNLPDAPNYSVTLPPERPHIALVTIRRPAAVARETETPAQTSTISSVSAAATSELDSRRLNRHNAIPNP